VSLLLHPSSERPQKTSSLQRVDHEPLAKLHDVPTLICLKSAGSAPESLVLLLCSSRHCLAT
jgi:hypothetical protein